ncbi:MAG: thiolase family protein [Caldilineaceae bacterium]|nr:thiolase family protein [Caldilineaceae bacterium]
MSQVYIVAAVRTPIGKFGGSLMRHSPADLGAIALRGALSRAGLSGKDLDLYILGNILRTNHGQLIARQAALKAGVPAHVDGYTLDMVCSSGMMAIMNGAMAIKAGEADIVLAGGAESMSQAAFALSHQARWGYKMVPSGSAPLFDTLTTDGLTDPATGEGMGVETERLAAAYGVTREEMDQVAALSHQRAEAATAAGAFTQEIVPVEITARGETRMMTNDEGIRPGTTPTTLAKLRPAFTDDGTITAGNASQISDGAAALILAGEEAVTRHNLTPLARYLGGVWSAGETWRFAEAPVPAVQKLSKKLGVGVEDFDLVENNEAFAVNSVLFNRELGIPYEKLNVRGGAIALGHPIGCSGARIVVTLIHALRETNGKLGLAALCHGMGGATALAIEAL